jgi:hypothetical protein
VIAHLHPARVDSASFDAALPTRPPLPGGRYRLYADVVHESGLARTLVATVDLPADRARAATAAYPFAGGADDGDDAWFAGAVTPARATAALGDGLTLAMVSAARVPAGRDTALRFVVRGVGGAVAEVEPYLGMAGHAMVLRDDGGVFVHLHPAGSVSMAAQERLLRRERATQSSTAPTSRSTRTRGTRRGDLPRGARLPVRLPRAGAVPRVGAGAPRRPGAHRRVRRRGGLTRPPRLRGGVRAGGAGLPAPPRASARPSGAPGQAPSAQAVSAADWAPLSTPPCVLP